MQCQGILLLGYHRVVEKSHEENLICESIPLSIDFESEKAQDKKSQLKVAGFVFPLLLVATFMVHFAGFLRQILRFKLFSFNETFSRLQTFFGAYKVLLTVSASIKCLFLGRKL